MSEEKLDVKISAQTEQLTTALKQAMTALQETSKVTEKLKNTSRDLKNMFDLLSREVSGMSEDNKRMMDSNKALASSNDKLRKSVSELKDDTKNLQSSNRELTSSNDRLKSAGEDLIKSMGRMSSEVSRNTEATTKNAKASDKAASSSKSFYERIQDAYGRVKKFGQELMQCYQAIEQYVVKVAELANQAKAIGASAEGYQKLAYAARETGTDMGAVSNAFQNVQKAMEQAQAGNEAMRDAIASLGLDLDRLFALSPDDRFAAIAEALSEIRDPAERSRIGVALLGEDFAKLNDYLDDFGSLSEQAKKDFDFIDERTISASKEYVENMERLDRAFTALVASKIAQTLADATEGMIRLNQLSSETGDKLFGLKEILHQTVRVANDYADEYPVISSFLFPRLMMGKKIGEKILENTIGDKFLSPTEQLQRQAGAAPTKQNLDDARKERDERLKAQAERQRRRDENVKAREARRKEAEEAITGRSRQRTEADAARQAEREERERQRAAERAARDEQTRKDRLFGAESALASAEMRLADLKARHKEAAARRETNALLKELDRQQRALDDQRKAQTAEPTTPAERRKRRKDIRLDASIAEKTALRNAGERVRFTKAEERRRKELKLLDAKEDDIRQRRARIQERQQRRQERAEQRQERRQMQEARKRVREARKRVAELQPDDKASAGQTAASDVAPVAAFSPSPLARGVGGASAAATGPSAIGQQLSAIQAILQQMSTKFYFVQG